MSPASLKKLTASQDSRISVMEVMRARMREKSLESLNEKIIQSRIDSLKDIWTEACRIHTDISSHDDTEDSTYVVDGVFARLQSLYEDCMDELLIMMSQLDIATPPSTPATPVSDSNTLNNLDSARLPRLDLPKFSGKYEEWESFSDLFLNLVHIRPASDATKLSYLKLCLTGIAADLVRDVATTDANYASTWQALKSRFFNPRMIVSNHLNALMNIAPLKRESASGLRSFADESQRIVRALTNLKMPVEHWSIWLIHILSAKLDPDSRKEWESDLSYRDRSSSNSVDRNSTSACILTNFPKFSEFSDFLEKRVQTLGMIAIENKPERNLAPPFRPYHGARKTFHLQRSPLKNLKCPFCSGQHELDKCFKFKSRTVFERRSEVRRLNLCYICFGNHRCNDCRSQIRCRLCKGMHHFLLHTASKPRLSSAIPISDKKLDDVSSPTPAKVNSLTASIQCSDRSVILATALVTLISPHGSRTVVRALLDPGSEASFVTEAVVQLLALSKRPTRISLSGLGVVSSGVARYVTTMKLCSRTESKFHIDMNALILPQLTSRLPSRTVADLDLRQFNGLTLADPNFHIQNSIDVLIGADIFGSILRSGLQRYPNSNLIAQNTALGWIISGPIQLNSSRRAEIQQSESSHPINVETLHCLSNDELNESLQRFWILEDLPESNSHLKPDEEICEVQFVETHTRDKDGKYIVRLPLKIRPQGIGVETRRTAVGSLINMHRRLSHDPRLAVAYKEFMRDYEQLGHMDRVPESEILNPDAWYIPHHAVVQQNLNNWKLRVVFDASRQTRERQCLNDFLRPGPALQSDLSLILLNWRRYRFAFTADIVKMFRQIKVAPEDQDLQRIVWSPNPGEKPVDFRLNTVTYGTSCAPFLAIRTLQQLAKDEEPRFPLGARCLKYHTYVDDIFAGSNQLAEAISKRKELSEMLRTACINLDKWAANHIDLLPPRSEPIVENTAKSLDRDALVKTLGVRWSPTRDVFIFTSSNVISTKTVTKRLILSNIAKLFDPLGWLAPVTVTAKILLQDLWILKCDWDTPLSDDYRNRWLNYCESFSALPELSLERWLGNAEGKDLQLHGFSDASTRAFAAAVYLRINDDSGKSRITLLAAKTKVAPVKTVSVPNLELCGAVLLVKLLLRLRKLEFLKNLTVFTWSDSQIVLSWLRKHPRTWKTFVANRVSYIQTELPSAKWAHVPTKENPADMATRGSKPIDLADSTLWWHGPSWLSLSSDHWPCFTEAVQTVHVHAIPEEPEILKKFSSLSKVIRVVAFCLRPILNLRRNREGLEPLPQFLTTAELNKARLSLIKIAQGSAFTKELEILRVGDSLPKRHFLNKLTPFVDGEGVMRVKGRLEHSLLTRNNKNPPILAHHSSLSRLFVRYAHRLCLHGGPTLTCSILSQNVWILGRVRLVKTELRNCLICQRVRPRLAHQLMGDLPSARVTPARPFSTSGLDYAGPIQVRTTKGRGHHSFKGYIVIFVCMATRAIHLEAVSDCTSTAFIAAFRRFTGRRGVCSTLYSDNATTFQGADAELRKMFKAASEFYNTTASLLANDGTHWSFIPPHAPHYGGLWEAGVKSTKHHLKRVIGKHTLTFEELSTVLIEIEACLNSRPICPLTSDVGDLNVLTPAHFLIGEASGLVPDEELSNVPENRLSRFQLIQRIRNNFWKRWSKEYLQGLQERNKWKGPVENFGVGQLVLLKDDRYPPTKWPLGRVTEVHPGPDELVRVVTVRTATTTLRRHVAQLCPLNLSNDGVTPT